MVERQLTGPRIAATSRSAPEPAVLRESADGLVVEVTVPGGDAVSDLTVACSAAGVRVVGHPRARVRPLSRDGGVARFESDIPIPEGFDVDRLAATYDRGILRLVVPRVEPGGAGDRSDARSGGAG